MPFVTRLCFLLPADADADAKVDHHSLFHPFKASSLHKPSRRNLSARARAALRWLCPRGRLCRCHPGDADAPGSPPFEDIAGAHVLTRSGKVGCSSPRIFTYSELYIATNGFSDKEILGSGGFGRVYRGVLPSDGSAVAVKCVVGRGERFEKTFAAELVAVAQLRHRNLVRLRGWCVHDEQLLLVYDYMPNRSLDRLLFLPASAGVQPLDWARRRRIVCGLAAALFYLHEQLDTQIIHRDVKTSNVMLDSEFNARLGDFGLARWIEHGDEFDTSMRSVSAKNYQFRMTETSRIGGTIGYLPPESFQKRGAATAKSDVFSFGIVVLEVATGRRAVDLAFPDDQIFMLDWARRLSDEGRCLEAGDHRLPDGSYPLSEMLRLIKLGLLCSVHDPQYRPTMKWVMENLSSGSSAELPALPSFQSQPQYISFSSSTSGVTTTTTITASQYLTAANSTLFLTADNGGGSSGVSSESRRAANPIPSVDTPREIPFKEIVAITNNFSESQMVAEMDFGTGYRGYLDNRFHVLVKRLGMRTCPALRARFSNELHNLARLRHRHLVQLRGWCMEQGEMLVIYDFSTRSLLGHHLFHRNRAVLPWRHRYSIVKCLASAVLYLHEEWEEQVIHRSITSSAIFLDPDMNPRLGSFALAEFLSRNAHGHRAPAASGRTSSARGIFGYMSPEYVETGEATTMADVYSFGVVVLEVVSGLRAVDFRSPEVLLVKKVWGFETRKRPLEGLADQKLGGKFNHRELMRLVKLGIACTRSNPESRPSMKQIVSILDGNDALLNMSSHKKESKEDWEGKNASSLSLVRRIQALGIQ
ncbi:hypothetical protein Cni_G23177 [Canna indica]|uniref:Protein kinase domain-containing protein n=1 Tax=Canna indica TaxID=4628 RepID=A0AAQ3KSN7_9LILI|nr:hypothetical protein Cni_G23177 [Canna indica]